MSETAKKLLIAASGTGGHLFPAIATAEQLSAYTIEWLGVPDRLETELVPSQYPLHTVKMGGFQGRLGLGSVRLLGQVLKATLQVRRLLKQEQFDGVFTTGGYIAAPAILAARSLGLPTILHESNALPGKVTRWLSPWCSQVALGFEAATSHLPKAASEVVGTPVRSQFVQHSTLPEDIDIPEDAVVVVVIGGSQGAVSLNRLVRGAAPLWCGTGAWVVHQTGKNDPEVNRLSHPQYIHRPFFKSMAGLFRRADIVISRAGAGTLTELAFTHTPSLLIPYPFAAEDHQAYNAAAFAAANAALVCRQDDLTPKALGEAVLKLINDPERRQQMSKAAASLAIPDSAEQLAELVTQAMEG
ncbi:undecaprenyldiphospho-muramoylpentapeptide beta-N-acetylglucosaminyltransferase [Oscillatoria sp. CS-180]|uniref:undecaprenyldiphospho-muramoylpentapeptide beta-N-acetylglucosaminyltransferase n=1 Tax=Oscillatoria sp. CS-180 TaxID=3021720 RepID=UPI00232D913A|nr:undecaprenyldiphospho-muramoylpentapeptide beta-N-acetylglucosaminyltransferase [Oscillatoria sp. CS-180]MDB9528991.1 undecaprenyldiphospho-muramoylpentapeptide beta-N-acetylglucosaminyltransferase [Oscillatoria sp. CS-180]